MTSLGAIVYLAALASGQTIDFMDPASNDYRVRHVRGVEYQGDVWDFTTWHGSAFSELAGFNVADPDTTNPLVETINSLQVPIPPEGHRTQSFTFPFGADEGPNGEPLLNTTYSKEIGRDGPLRYERAHTDLNYGMGVDAPTRPDTAWLSYDLALRGDADHDGRFTSDDLMLVMAAGLYETEQPATWQQGDFDRDGLFGTGDLVAALASGSYEQPAATVVPEPSTLWLLFGLFAGAWRIRRKS